jgi:hypothetical protein
MRMSLRPRPHGKGGHACATPALPCAPSAAPSTTNAHSPAWFRRRPLSGAVARAGEATHTRRTRSHTTRTHVTANEGVTT